MSGRSVEVTVAVLTYRRTEELKRCLPAVLAAAVGLNELAGTRVNVDVLVVDNDPTGSARSVVQRYADPAARYVVEPRPGIAYGRNRALDECAGSDAVVFIDDDERPEGLWLEPLITLWLLTAAAGVGGRVISDFEVAPTGWVEAGRFFDRRSMPTGSVIDVCATNNLLLDLEALRERELRFDESLGLGGGEDTLLTRQLTRAGGVLLWCDEAVVSEHVPAERVERSWVSGRSWSHGNTLAKVELRLSGGGFGTARCAGRLLALGCVRVLVGVGRAGMGVVLSRPADQARGTRSLLRGAGMVAAVFGLHYAEYARRRVAPIEHDHPGDVESEHLS